MYGSILADAVSMIVRVAIIIVISKRCEDIGLKLRDFIKSFVVIEVFICAGLLLSVFKYQSTFSILNFAYKCLVVLAYIAVVLLMNRTVVTAFINKIRNKKQRSK